MTRARPLTPLTRSGVISFENGGQSSKRGRVSSCQPITRPRSAVDKLTLASTTLRRPEHS